MGKYEKIGWWLTIIISGLILFSVFLAPLFYNRQPTLSAFIYLLYSPLCHQQPSRSYFIFGHQLAVCSRCLGIYAGFFLSALIYPIWKRKLTGWISSRPMLIIVSAIPMGIDFFSNLLGIASSPLWIKTISGVIWSAIIPFFWFKAISELADRLSTKF
ncbi:MAG: DUF2085 domain-containing protein [Candidatus Saccharicenans sp.]|nr:MAG: hypothetical protein C0168_05805 [Candidatus Aminicenantes bacterium]HEK86703.1 DUF2085 domain-containing protein [Candidatus Aminicenantes bacterium]